MYNNNQPMPVRVLKMVVMLCMLLWILPPVNNYAQTNPQSSAPAQQQSVLVGVTFLKVRPGKHDQYQQLVEKYGKKINEHFYKKENLIGWYLYSILIPSGSTAEYDYAAVNIVRGGLTNLLDPPGSQKELLKKVFPEMTDKMITDLIARYDSARIVVRREVFAPVDDVHTGDTSNPVPAKYLSVDMMHPASGKTEEYIKMERETFKPLHLERMKAGHLRNWGLYQKVFADDRAGFEYVTVNFYDNLDKLGVGFEDALKKVMPQTNMNTLFTQTLAARTMIRTEVWKLVHFVDRSNTKK